MPRPLIPPPALLAMPTYALSLLGREAHDQMAAALPEGLRLGHLAVLGVLADDAPRSQRALAGVLGLHSSDVVGIVDDLAARGLAVRVTDPADRRRNLVRPTPAGRRLLRQSTRDSERISAGLLASLAADERRTVEDLLRRALAAWCGSTGQA